MSASQLAHEATSDLNKAKDQNLVRTNAFINGQWVAARSGEAIEVTNPATLSVLGAVSALSAEESSGAVDDAQNAFSEWSQRVPQNRSVILRRWYDLVLENKEDLCATSLFERRRGTNRC